VRGDAEWKVPQVREHVDRRPGPAEPAAADRGPVVKEAAMDDVEGTEMRW